MKHCQRDVGKYVAFVKQSYRSVFNVNKADLTKNSLDLGAKVVTNESFEFCTETGQYTY